MKPITTTTTTQLHQIFISRKNKILGTNTNQLSTTKTGTPITLHTVSIFEGPSVTRFAAQKYNPETNFADAIILGIVVILFATMALFFGMKRYVFVS